MKANFTRHRYELPTLIVFFVIAVAELLAVHLLVSIWSTSVAWLLSALTIAMLSQIALLVHGMIKWPTVVDDTVIYVRHGRRGEILVPLKMVANITCVAFQPEERGPETFRATVLAQPNVAVHLSEPLRYGRRLLSCITMRLDQPASFLALIEASIRR